MDLHPQPPDRNSPGEVQVPSSSVLTLPEIKCWLCSSHPFKQCLSRMAFFSPFQFPLLFSSLRFMASHASLLFLSLSHRRIS